MLATLAWSDFKWVLAWFVGVVITLLFLKGGSKKGLRMETKQERDKYLAEYFRHLEEKAFWEKWEEEHPEEWKRIIGRQAQQYQVDEGLEDPITWQQSIQGTEKADRYEGTAEPYGLGKSNHLPKLGEGLGEGLEDPTTWQQTKADKEPGVWE